MSFLQFNAVYFTVKLMCTKLPVNLTIIVRHFYKSVLMNIWGFKYSEYDDCNRQQLQQVTPGADQLVGDTLL